MPRFGPIKRADCIATLRPAGFEEPFFGAKHQVMIQVTTRIAITNQHFGDVGKELLSRLLRKPVSSRGDWEKLWVRVTRRMERLG